MPRIEAVIRSASRRRISTLAVEQFALAFALVFSGGILLLLLGTEILAWYWLLLLGGTGSAIATFRISRGRLTPYRVAQLLDQRLQLSDSLSTAWFLRSGASRRDDSVTQLQIARAEELAGSVRLKDAFPFAGQRAWTMTAALAAVAFGLFAVRYLVTSSLSLQQSLIPLHLDGVFERSKDPRSPEAHSALRPRGNQGEGKLFAPETGDRTQQSDSSLPQESTTSTADASASASSTTPVMPPQTNGKRQDGQSPGDEHSGSNANAADKAGQSAHGEDGSKTSSKSQGQSKNGQDQNGREQSPGLMDNMKDALSSLMAKLRPNQTPPAGNSQASARKGEQPDGDRKSGGQNSAGKDPRGQPQNSSNQQASQDQNSGAQAQGETKEKAQASPGQNSDQSPASGSDARSGVGRQDGDKNVKEAGQLQAMGKLEQIIGKRSANLTGEMTVETPSNKQQLKTEYSQRLGRHSDSGGEINRDEVPLIDQQYVREYMERVRNQAKSAQ